jgi:biopolymer transport protein ExbD
MMAHATCTTAPSGRQRRKLRVSADMNVTPLIDVLLVLLDHLHGALPLTQKARHQPPLETNANA